MNADKTVAKKLSKFNSGKLNEKNLYFLIDYFINNSTLKEKLGKDIPGIIEVNGSSWSGEAITKGEYSQGENKIKINGSLIEKTCQGDVEAMVDLINTIAHEYTHYYQYLNDKNHSQESLRKLVVEDVVEMLELADYAEEKINSNPYLIQTIAHGSYMGLQYERDARAGGEKFVDEVLEALLVNEYLKDNIKQKIKEQVHFKKEVDKVMERECVGNYERFINFLKSRNIEDYMNEKAAKNEGNMNFDRVLDIWINSQDSKKLLENYSQLVGTGNKYPFLRKKISKAIKSDRVSKEDREKFSSKVVATLIENDLEKVFYEKELKDILNNKQVLEMYELLLKGNAKKLDGSLFVAEFFNRNDEMRLDKIKIILRNSDYIIENISKYDTEDLNAIKNQISAYLRGVGVALNDEVKEVLCELKDCIQSNIYDKEKVENVTVR